MIFREKLEFSPLGTGGGALVAFGWWKSQSWGWFNGADPGGEEEISHPWLHPEASSIPRKILWKCWLRFSGAPQAEDVLYKHLGLGKREVIPDPFCCFLNFAFCVGNWSTIDFRSLLSVSELLMVIPWFFPGYCPVAELIPFFPEEILVVLMSFVVFLQTFAWYSTSSRGYSPHRGTLSLDLNPRELE